MPWAALVSVGGGVVVVVVVFSNGLDSLEEDDEDGLSSAGDVEVGVDLSCCCC